MCSALLVRCAEVEGGGGVMDWYGYTGKILKVNLTDAKVSIEQENPEDLKTFIGGIGMNCKLAADFIKPKTDPFSPENSIIIGAGPLVGTITPGSSRIVGLTKFPASGAIANSCGSMSFGLHLKHAGFDHLIVSGKADHPVYLQIWDDQIELCDAGQLWGRDIVEATDSLHTKYESCGVIAIGQAGENLAPCCNRHKEPGCPAELHRAGEHSRFTPAGGCGDHRIHRGGRKYMSEKIFENQALDLTLVCRDNDNQIIDLTGKTVHFLTRDPQGNETTDTEPDKDDKNGKVKHSYPINTLTPVGGWMAKVLIDGTEVPSTRYAFQVYGRWGA